MTKYSSIFQQLFHFLAYSIKRPRMKLERGMFITSIDVDAGNRNLGVLNQGKNDVNVHKYISEYHIGEIEELTLPLFVETLNDFEIPATLAVRGQLTEVNNSLPETLEKSNVKHDIGAHGYYHRHFTSISRNEAENELNLISVGMKKFSITPKSFIFPAGKVAYLDLLEKYGYKCFRGYGDYLHDCMYIERKGQLYNVHPSLYVDQGANRIFLRKILDISVANKLPFHIWFHLWNFGEEEKSVERIIRGIFVPLFRYAREKEKNGKLTFETMLSATKKVEKEF